MRSISIIAFVSIYFLVGPVGAGVFNEGQRNGPQRIAPGSIILIKAGIPVGPTRPQIAGGFPLTTNLGGTSVRIVIGDASVSAYVLAVESEWVRALVPSNTPLGDGRVIVTYNGRESPPDPIHVAERGFAIFDGTYAPPGTLAPSFYFPRTVQNVSLGGGTRINSLVDSASPGELVVLWGTGLGAAPGDEAAGPIPSPLDISGLTVFVGDKAARIAYAGRSGCCAGMDQIVFEVPPRIEGCNVPVWVRYSEQGHGSNAVYVSINAMGGACADLHGLTEAESRSIAAGSLFAGRIYALRDEDTVEWFVQFGRAINGRKIPLGTCVHGGWDLGGSSINITSPLDAGAAIKIQGERAAYEVPKHDRDTYSGRFSGRLAGGNYVVENGSGSEDVGAFRALLSVPLQPAFTWTNRASLVSASIAEGVTVNWTGGDTSGYVVISGLFEAGGEAWGNGEFLCYAAVDRGTFTLPPALLARLASDWIGRPTYPGANYIHVSVRYAVTTRFEIPGFGVGELQTNERIHPSAFAAVALRP